MTETGIRRPAYTGHKHKYKYTYRQIHIQVQKYKYKYKQRQATADTTGCMLYRSTIGYKEVQQDIKI